MNILKYDRNNNLLGTITDVITDEGYGLYRLPVNGDFTGVSYITIQIKAI